MDNEFEVIEVTINHDARGDTKFEDLAEFVDSVRKANPSIEDHNIRMLRNDELSDHQDVTYYVEV